MSTETVLCVYTAKYELISFLMSIMNLFLGIWLEHFICILYCLFVLITHKEWKYLRFGPPSTTKAHSMHCRLITAATAFNEFRTQKRS